MFNSHTNYRINSEEATVKTDLGYQISQTKEVTDVALHKAFEIVKAARKKGVLTRNWAVQALAHAKKILNNIQQLPTLRSNPDYTEMKVWEMAQWENDTAKKFHIYMENINQLLDKLKALNPPLTTGNIRPFIEAIHADRHLTVDILVPISHFLTRFSTLRTDRDDFTTPISPRHPIP